MRQISGLQAAVGLTGATGRRGAVRLTAGRGAAAARGRARRVLRPRGVARALRAVRAVRCGAARCAAAGRLGLRSGFAGCAADLRLARGAPFFAVLDPESCFWARRARFQTLRAAAECLRARLASRLASFRRLRARFSSSFAMRTRCLATSACSRTRSRGSAGVSCSLPVFFIGGLATRKTRSLTQARGACHRGSYPQNLCITMWTDAARVRKRSAPARGCVMMNGFSPASVVSARLRRRVSVGGGVQYGGGAAVAAGVIPAVERRVGDLQDALREAALADGHAVESAQPETGSHFDALAFRRERGLRDRGPHLAGDVERRLIAGLGQHDGEFLAADARHPVDAVPQAALQARAELPQDLIATGVAVRVVDALEQIDVA